MVVKRGWVLRCSLSLFQKILPDSPYIFFWTVDVWAFKSIYDFTLLKFAVPVLGGHEECFMVLVPLKCTWIPKLLHVLVNISHNPWMQGTIMEMLLLLLGWLSVEVCPLWMLFLWIHLFCRTLRAHGGKLQACRAFLMCSISLCSACCVVQTTLAHVLKCWKHYFLLW